MSETNFTPGEWTVGYPPGGITGPNTPAISGVTVAERCRHEAWARIENARSEPPPNTHIIITKGQNTIAICCGDVDWIDAQANAALIAAAPELLESLATLVDEALSPTFQGTLSTTALAKAQCLIGKATSILEIKEPS